MTEFDDVIRRLEDERPQASARELDEIKQRVRRRAADPSRKGSQSMKSRLAILGMLVTGMLFSTAGAGLAISGLQDNASVSQYGTPVCTPTPAPQGGVNPAETPTTGAGGGNVCEEGGVLPAEESNPAPEESGSGGGGAAPSSETEGGVLPAEESAATQTQPERQVAAQAESTSQLPMTGFAAIPVLLGGLALLAGGLILRRRSA